MATPQAAVAEAAPAGRRSGVLPFLSTLPYRLSRDEASALERQLPFTVVYCVGLLYIPADVVPLFRPPLLYLSMLVVVAHLVLAVVVPWRRLPERARAVLPLLQFVAIDLLWVATPARPNPLSALVFLPAVGLALLRGRFGVWLGFGCGFLVAILPLITDDSIQVTFLVVMRTLYLPTVVVTVALTVNEVTRRLRLRTDAVNQLRLVQNEMLRSAARDAVELERRSEELRATRDAWASVLDAATEQAIMATDSEGELELFNPGAVKLLGHAPDGVLGRGIQLFFDLDEVEQRRVGEQLAEASVIDVIAGGAASGGTDVRDWSLVRADGVRRTTRIAVTRRAPTDGARGGYAFVATDVTEERESARLKDEFVGLVSHELRTPISSVLGYVALLREGEGEESLTEEQSGYLDVVERNSRRLLRLVGDLLLSAQVDAGTFQVNHEAVDLATVVADALQVAAPLARGSGVTLVATPAGRTLVDGDLSRLGQVVDNLVSNALKFTPRGGEVVVDLFAAQLADGRPAVALRVTDSGIGIPPDELRRTFDRFYRASSATRRAIPGVGLGLSVTKAIVDAHGGEIEVESDVGRGTAFTVLLPAVRSLAAPAAAGRGEGSLPAQSPG